MSYPTLPEVWTKVEIVSDKLGLIQKRKPAKLTHKELTEIRDTLNECAENVQTIRDMIVFE